MSIVCDESDERQTSVDRMIDEFRTAQSRRLAKVRTTKGDDRVVESQRDDQTLSAVAGPTPTPAAH
jgi:hypothetical protein